MSERPLNVCIVGGGIGGLTAAIAIRRAGAHVTILEQATQLGEIGAGIQMLGNVSRFLIRTGVDKIIGENLVEHDELRNWTINDDDSPDPFGVGKLISKSFTKDVHKDQGFPWWVVRRDHLHAGLTESAKHHGANVIIGSKVVKIDSTKDGVDLVTKKGRKYHFDLVIGADGINSTVRQALFPKLQPRSVSKVAAFRAVVPYETIYEKIPEAKEVLKNTMDYWLGPGGYILLYPLSAGRELNIVTAFRTDHYVQNLEDLTVEEFRDQYKDFPPFIRKVLDLVPATKRWPLKSVPPSSTWSNEHKNIVMMGDAIHGMQNHMAQGAATAMEDAIFLGRILGEVQRNAISLNTAIHLYEKKRIPRAWHKQQSAVCQGEILSCGDIEPALRTARDSSESALIAAFNRDPANPKSQLAPTFRSSMMWTNPDTIPGILYYDAEGDADWAVGEYLMGVPHETDGEGEEDWDSERWVSRRLLGKWWTNVWDNGVSRWERAWNGKGNVVREKEVTTENEKQTVVLAQL